MGIDNLYRIVYIESKFLSEVIEMDISNTISAVKVSGSSSSSVKKTSEKNKWQLTDVYVNRKFGQPLIEN